MAGHIQLTGDYLRQAEALLQKVVQILQVNVNNYSLEGGTLLGIVREGRLLPWDSDVDLSVMYDDIHDLDRLLKSLKKSGLRVRLRKNTNIDERLPADMPRIIKIRFKRFFGLLKSKVCLDVFIKYRVGDKVYWGVGDLMQSAPAYYYDSYDTINFKGERLSVPVEFKLYLDHKYGDWKTPVKKWSTFIDDLSIEKE